MKKLVALLLSLCLVFGMLAVASAETETKVGKAQGFGSEVTVTITLEDGVMLGPEVALLTVNHEPKNIRTIMTKEIRIRKNAWIGARVSILPGVTIGENAIVGTGSIVTKDVPDNAVVVGNPARIVKMIE